MDARCCFLLLNRPHPFAVPFVPLFLSSSSLCRRPLSFGVSASLFLAARAPRELLLTVFAKFFFVVAQQQSESTAFQQPRRIARARLRLKLFASRKTSCSVPQSLKNECV
jgi:hypothetical protein